jgi:hypothetical protein
MKTTQTSMLTLSGCLLIAASAIAALPPRDAPRPIRRPVADLSVRPPAGDARELATFASIEIARLPITRVDGGTAFVPFLVEPRVTIGYPYVAQVIVDGMTLAERVIPAPSAVILEARVKRDGVDRQACVRVRRMGTLVAPQQAVERCFDVTMGYPSR